MAPGLRGFQEKGEAGYDFTAGSVLGLRWFWMPRETLPNPLDPEPGDMPPVVLNGQTGFAYADGVNEATCNAGQDYSWMEKVARRQHLVPEDDCGCGFWAYWDEEEARKHDGGHGGLPVLGVVEATGRVIHGELGFRAQKAQIVAVHPGFTIQLEMAPDMTEYRHKGVTWTRDMLADAAQAAQASLETRIQDAYPLARVYSVKAAMLAAWPPGKGFLS